MADGFNFSDWFGDKKKEYHRITIPSHPMMEEVGLFAFNSGTLYDVLKRDKNICVSGDESVFSDDPLVNSGITYDDDFAFKTYTKILDTYPSVDLATIKFWWNGEILKPLTVYVSGVHKNHHVLGALEQHHDWVTAPSGGYNPNDQWSERKSFLSDVQTSLGGSGIVWRVPLCFQFGTSGVDGANCTKCDWVTFNARLYDFDNMSQEKRVTAIVGDGVNGPLITAAPTTAYGKPGLPDIGLGPGIYADPVTDDPHSLVAAPLSMHFNQNTGLFESGSRQMIAALMTDCDGIEVKSVDATNVNIVAQNEICAETGSMLYQGAFNLGRAMPMGVKGTNPNVFGPDLTRRRCETHDEKEMVVVVNRSAKSYKQGERVLLSHVDGEWLIIQSLSDRNDEAGFKMGKWGPTHYMMAPAEILYSEISQIPQRHELSFHQRFYYELGNTSPGIAANVYPELNNWKFLAGGPIILDANGNEKYVLSVNGGDDVDFSTHDSFWQHTSFDMMSDDLGGVNQWNYLSTTNPHHGADGKAHNEETKIHANFPFHGLTFPDGYSTTQMSRAKLYSDKDLLNTKAVELAGRGFYLRSKNKAKVFDNTMTLSNLAGGGHAKNVNRTASMFGVKNSTLQVPADIALNAPPDGVNGFPIESLGYLKECFPTTMAVPTGNKIPTINGGGVAGGMIAGVKKYLASGVSHVKHQERYSWMEYEVAGFSSRYSLYDWKPINNRRVSFIPLAAELYTHYDYPNPVYQGFGSNQGLEDPYNTFVLPQGSTPPIPAFPEMIYPGPYDHANKHLDILGDKFFVRETDGGGGSVQVQQPGNGQGYTNPPFSFSVRRPQGNENVNSWLIDAGSEVPVYQSTNPPVLASPLALAPVVERYRVLPYSAMFTKAEFDPNDPYREVPGNYYSRWMRAYWNRTLGVGTGDWGVGAGTYSSDGANAVGIITTKVRMQTNAANFSFTGEQLLGVDGYTATNRQDAGMIGSVLASIFGGGDFFGGTVNGNLIGQWGKGQGFDTWNAPNTSTLYARVVDAWPDEQTIFDPRTFSVHHFHAGELGSEPLHAWYSGGLPLKNNNKLIYDNENWNGRPDPAVIPLPHTLKYSNVLFSDGIYMVDIRHFDTDFRVPTYIGTVGNPSADDSVGDFVPVGLPSNPTLVDVNSPLRKKLDWRVNPVKRGMLMPFHYFHRTIGVGRVSIENGGDKYQVGDILFSAGGTGGGCYVRVKLVSNGAITEVEFISDIVADLDTHYQHQQNMYGFAYSHDDFIPSGTCYNIDPRTGPVPHTKALCERVAGTWSNGYSNSKVKFINYSAGADDSVDKFLPAHKMVGEGAEIFADKGIVYDFYNPEGELNKTRALTPIALPSQQGAKPSTNGRADGGFQTYLEIGEPSPDLAYDVFFHFKSDISYVNKGPNSWAQSYLQYLDMTVGVSEPAPKPRKPFSWLSLLMRRLFPELDAPGSYGNPDDYKTGGLSH
jgi:hypothetical protein